MRRRKKHPSRLELERLEARDTPSRVPGIGIIHAELAQPPQAQAGSYSHVCFDAVVVEGVVLCPARDGPEGRFVPKGQQSIGL